MSHRLGAGAVALLCLVAGTWCAQADEPTAKPATVQVKADNGNVDVAKWPTLIKELRGAGQQLNEIDTEYQKIVAIAESKRTKEQAARLLELQKLAVPLYTKIQTELFPAAAEMAPVVYQGNPKDVDAAEFVIDEAIKRNRFTEVMKVGAAILSVKPDHAGALNMLGVAYYGQHDFAKAQQYFSRAAELKVLFPMLQNYADTAPEYEKYWETEKAIRAKQQAAKGEAALPQVVLRTTKGDIYVELYEDEAPNTVANFISLVESKFYDGLRFHRVIPNFMAQGGCPYSREGAEGQPGTGDPGYSIPCECFTPKARMHFSGSLSMAHAGKDTGGSQFFLTHLPTAHLNPNAATETGHTVFGGVIKGLDIARSLEINDEIKTAVVVRKRNHKYEPKKLAAAPE